MNGRPKTGCLAQCAMLFLSGVVAPLLLLAAAEGVLRLADVGQTTRFALEKDYEGLRFHVPNKAFYQQFSLLPIYEFVNWDELDFQAVAEERPERFRIFVFGGSAVHGPTSAPRILEVMLEAAFPGIAFEILNAACPGMNSHVMAPAAEAGARLDPDCFLIYMGNNETMGPYGPNTRIARYPFVWHVPVVRALIALNDLRLYQLFNQPGGGLAERPTPEELVEMQPRPTDEARPNRHYRANLARMLDAAERVGAHAVVCTLAHNWRYEEPGKPMPPLDPDDFDRGTTNRTVLDLARARGNTLLADTERALIEAADDGVPDYTHFVDNIHFSFHGAYVVARAIFPQVVAVLRERGRIPADADPVPPNEAACAEALAWNRATRAEMHRFQLNVIHEPASRALVESRLAELEAALDGREETVWRAAYERALALRPHDWRLRHKYAEGLLYRGELDAARVHAQRLVDSRPYARVSYRTLAQVLRGLHAFDAALEAAQRALALYPDDIQARDIVEALAKRGASP